MLKVILVSAALVAGTSSLAVAAPLVGPGMASTAPHPMVQLVQYHHHYHHHHRVLANGRCNGRSYGTGQRSCGTATGGTPGGNPSRN